MSIEPKDINNTENGNDMEELEESINISTLSEDPVKEEKDEKLELLQNKANNGDSGSQLLLGIYLFDQKHNFTEGFNWMLMSAERGNSIAQFRVGKCYLEGKGTEYNTQLGIKWLNKSSGRGYAEASVLLAQCYFAGRGVSFNNKKGYELLVSAAQKDNVAGINGAGWCCLKGIGTPVNYIDAEKYYSRLTILKKNNIDGFHFLGVSQYYQQKFKEAIESFTIAGKMDDVRSQLFLAQIYSDGDGLENNEPDEEKAEYWLEKAAELGSKAAAERLELLRENKKKINELLYKQKNETNKWLSVGSLFWILCVLVALAGVYFYQYYSN